MSNLSETGRSGRPTRKSSLPSTRTLLGVTFGIFMVIIYVGMGVLLLINFFDWSTDWAWTRYIVGIVLIVYGFFRAWRQYKDFTRRDDE
ncbi:MAG: hypothetical protein NC406_01760 [Bacteroides sp.]|nr:hypothetical protein [Bacteroides sp.]MCM1094666.1 hypothetical protein [Terasakiella sp.]